MLANDGRGRVDPPAACRQQGLIEGRDGGACMRGRMWLAGTAVLVLAAGCGAPDRVGEAAAEICDAIDGEPTDAVAYEGYLRAVEQHQRAGLDEDELRAAVEQRCGRALNAITAAAEADAPAEQEGGPDDDPADDHTSNDVGDAEVAFVDLAEHAWLDQPWVSDCTDDGVPRALRLELEPEHGAVHRPADGSPTPVFVVELDGAVFGDLTGNGHDDAVFVTQCVFANAATFLEVWSHDEHGQPRQLGVLEHYSKWERTLDRVEIVDTTLRVHTREGLEGAETPHIDGYPIEVVTDWSFDGTGWSAELVSRSDPPPAEPEPPAVPTVCAGAGISVDMTAQCLVAAVNARAYDTAERITDDEVLSRMRSWREEWGPLDWSFEGCDQISCWFYEPSNDPQFHGVGIEMGHDVVHGLIAITWLETYG